MVTERAQKVPKEGLLHADRLSGRHLVRDYDILSAFAEPTTAQQLRIKSRSDAN
jgi:hypothetical protein